LGVEYYRLSALGAFFIDAEFLDQSQ
jgi:predicted ATP-dependent Lon-type protease